MRVVSNNSAPAIDAATLNSVVKQLGDDGVAFTYSHPDNATLNDGLVSALPSVPATADAQVGIVVVEAGARKVGALRNIAQDVRDASGFETVIVRTHGGSGVLSTNLTRAQIEAGMHEMNKEWDFVNGVRVFGSTAEAAEIHGSEWIVAGGVTLFAMLAIVIATALTCGVTRLTGTRVPEEDAGH